MIKDVRVKLNKISGYLATAVLLACAVVSCDDSAAEHSPQTQILADDFDFNTGDLTYVSRYRNSTTLDAPNATCVSPDGLYVYVTSGSLKSIIWLSRNSTTGALTYAGVYTDPAIAYGPNNILISADGGHVYASSAGGTAITWFTRNAGTGALTFAGSYGDAAAFDGCMSMSFAPGEEIMYSIVMTGVTTTMSHIAWLNRNTTTGSLTYAGRIEANPVGAVAVSSDGRHVYSIEGSQSAESKILWYSRDVVTGALTYIDSYASVLLLSPQNVVISNDGNYVYVNASYGSSVTWFSRNADTGALVFLDYITRDTAPSIKQINAMKMSPDQRNIYVASSQADALAVTWFARSTTTGALRYMGHYTPLSPTRIGISPDGSHVYVTSLSDDSISWFSRAKL